MSKKDKKQIAKIIELLENIGILKRIPRMGWKLRGIPECETVASHSFRVVFITLVIAEILKDKYSINFEKLLKIATLHEIPEAFITDLALKPAKYIGFDIKQKAEIAAFKDIFSGFDFEKQYLEYWLEFENNTTIEGKLVKIADKLDMLLQAYEYEKIGLKKLDDFWKNTANFEDYDIDLITELFDELKKLHSKLKN